MTKKNNKLLYLGPSGIGDWCFIYPSLPALLHDNQCTKLDVIVPYQNAGNGLLPLNELVDSISYLHRPTTFAGAFAYFFRFLRLIWHVRQQKYQVLVVSYLSNQIDFLILSLFSGIKIRVGVPRGVLSRTVFTRKIDISEDKDKVTIHKAYSKKNCPSSTSPPFLDIKKLPNKDDIVAKNSIPGNYIILGIGGGRKAGWRFWPAKHFQALILKNKEVSFLLMGGGDDDAKQAQNIMNDKTGNALNLVNKVTMQETASLLCNADGVIGNDSGITNISATFGVPTLCIYGPTNPQITGSAILGAEVVQGRVDCGPCFMGDQNPTTATTCSHRQCLDLVDSKKITLFIKNNFQKAGAQFS